jgi:hypothetical protein
MEVKDPLQQVENIKEVSYTYHYFLVKKEVKGTTNVKHHT